MSMLQNAEVHPFTGFDLPHLIDLQSRAHSDRPFLRWVPQDGETMMTYAEFKHKVQRVAAAMKRRGVRKGDRILIHLENCPEGVIGWFACAWIGAVAVMTNARAARAELEYFVAHSGASAAITQPKLYSDVAAACCEFRWVAVTETDNGDPPAAGTAPSAEQSFSVLLASDTLEPLRAPEPLLPVGIQYTSGTTSRPKGVMMTHANALWGGKIGSAHARLNSDDVFLVHLPLYHVIALSYGLLSTLWVGGTVVLMPRFSARRFWPISVAHRCTWSAMVPFCVRALAEQEVPEGHSYRAWGNAFWSAEFERRYRISILGWWGMTEIITHGIVGDPGMPGHAGAIGRPAPEYQLSIRRDDGTPVESGETGHLMIRGQRGVSVFLEYLNDPAATAASFDETGYFKTGDLVTLHPDGFIQFADRAKDMLKVGGENVAASEVERVVMSVSGVREVAVVGKPHTMLGEVAVAFVVRAKPTDSDLCEAILAACANQLAPFKVPRDIHFVEELPRGLTEKVSKVELRIRASQATLDAGR
jgi:crotonobetaine/carnitine-CoA ligase